MLSEHPEICPCQSTTHVPEGARRYAECCQPIHDDIALALSPETLMRARYSAFCLGLTAFLVDSWEEATCPPRANLSAPGPAWIALEILESEQHADTGMVRFHATFFEQTSFQQLKERSRFRHDGHHWRYIDGEADWLTLDIGRNSLCPCHSGKKAKRCCAKG